MRIRTITAALSGVLALTVLGAPAAHAAGSDDNTTAGSAMHNPPMFAVPPDPYVVSAGSAMHNPPMYVVPPDPYVVSAGSAMHNPPTYAVPPDPYFV
jgi:hypothetical protein